MVIHSFVLIYGLSEPETPFGSSRRIGIIWKRCVLDSRAVPKYYVIGLLCVN